MIGKTTIEIVRYPSEKEWKKLTIRPTFDNSHLNNTVQSVLSEIKQEGDRAVKAYTLKFDRVELDSFSVSEQEISEASSLVPAGLKEAIRIAKANIEKFHASQKQTFDKIETSAGVSCWQKAISIEKVGLYIPGGTAPLFSTVLMLGIPAKIAGCREIVLCTPPDQSGKIHPAILYTAELIGISKIFKVGGVQAIGAMAYGTETIPQVYKIFGPGNQYVTTAKQLINREGVAIDMPAGPSEVEVIADETAKPAFVAADLLSQAEHGADSQAILVSTSESLINRVIEEIDIQLNNLPRKEIAIKALMHSRIILLNSTEEMIRFTNAYAPEHLIIETKDYQAIADKIINAGSVFLGHYTPESAGDYASGTNHTLPTNGFAKAYSGVNLDSYLKKITFQEITKEGIENIGETIEIMAANEGLDAHKNAVSIRKNNP